MHRLLQIRRTSIDTWHLGRNRAHLITEAGSTGRCGLSPVGRRRWRRSGIPGQGDGGAILTSESPSPVPDGAPSWTAALVGRGTVKAEPPSATSAWMNLHRHQRLNRTVKRLEAQHLQHHRAIRVDITADKLAPAPRRLRGELRGRVGRSRVFQWRSGSKRREPSIHVLIGLLSVMGRILRRNGGSLTPP